ncbi:MAG: hypothetical protein M0Z49_00545 [Chloroflexi bacterium]|nr:hypothetical protein [Chloroflexota bacterium]
MATTAARSGRPSTDRSDARAQGHPSITARNVNQEDRRFLERHGERLSKTTLRATWAHSPDEHEDRPGQTLATRSPEGVRAWAEARGGEPATAETSPSKTDHRPHVLRINFPGRGGRLLTAIGWNDWLKSFQGRDLVFLFLEHTRDGRESNFFRLDNPKRTDA